MTGQRQEYTNSTQTGVSFSTQTGVYIQYRDRSIKTVHRQEYTDSTKTGV
jgi:hypothetical protein